MNRWATFLIVAFVAAVLLALTGCSGKDAYREMILTDEESGCQYIGYVADGALTSPQLRRRIGANGKQVCK